MARWRDTTHSVVGLLRQDRSATGSVKTKRLRADWDDRYLLKLLNP